MLVQLYRASAPHVFVAERNLAFLPANATTVLRPVAGENEWWEFRPRENAWRVVADFRGRTVYDRETREASVVDDVGPVPENKTLKVPSAVDDHPDAGAWLYFDRVTDEWRVDVRKKLEAIAARRRFEIEVEHDRRIRHGVEFRSLLFSASGEAERLLREAIDANEWPVLWPGRDFLAEESIRLESRNDALELKRAISAFRRPIKEVRYGKEMELSRHLKAGDLAGVMSLDPLTGWPGT